MKIAIFFTAVLFGCILNIAATAYDLRLDNTETKGTSILDLDKLKSIYKSIETCVKDGKTDFEICMEGAITLKNLKNRLIEISTNNAREINAYDRTENTCLRHFITGNIFPDFSLTFDLEKCLKNGFKGAVVPGHESENWIYGFWNLRIALWSCRRVDSNKTNITKCIFETIAATADDLGLDNTETNIAALNSIAVKIYAALKELLNYLQIKGASILDLDKLKSIYKSIETCVKDGKTDFEICMKRAITLKNLKNRLIEISTNNAKEINAYDRTENTCLRHFITGNIFPDFSLTFDLEKCLKNGFKGAVVPGNESENLIYGFWNLRIALWSCRVDSNKTNIEKCISEKLDTSNEARAISRTIQSISEDELKNPNNKVYESFNNENDCTGYIFEKLNFRGLFMEDLEKNELKECINRRYVASPDIVLEKNAINKYKPIADSLDKCTQYPPGSELSTCVSETIDASASSLDYIHQILTSFQKDTSAYNKCLDEILNRRNKLCSSNMNALCSYPEIERCLTNRKQEKFGTPVRYSNHSILSLKAGSTLTVTGYILPSLLGFSVNLKIDELNTALHVNPRFTPKPIIAINIYKNGVWPWNDGKGTIFPILPKYNLHRGSKCVMRISITDSFYTISINGVEVTNFKHRLPYKSVGYVAVYGDLDYISLDQN